MRPITNHQTADHHPTGDSHRAEGKYLLVQHHYAAIPPDKSERRTFRLEAKTPVAGGTLAVLPPTYYELNLPRGSRG